MLTSSGCLGKVFLFFSEYIVLYIKDLLRLSFNLILGWQKLGDSQA